MIRFPRRSCRAAIGLCLWLLPASGALAMSDLEGVWRLTAIGGAEVAATVTLDLTEAGRISGQGPCNRYSGPNGASLPDLRIGPMISTRMACPEMALEGDYFSALSGVTRATLGKDDLLVLSGDGAADLTFRRQTD
jgi:heat shock protein HslJ